MQAKEYALSVIRRSVPVAILKEAFLPKKHDVIFDIQSRNVFNAESLDSLIASAILADWVAVDMNLFGGEETQLPIDSKMIEYVSNTSSIIRFSPDVLMNRDIVTPYEICTAYPDVAGIHPGLLGTQNYNTNHSSPLVQATTANLRTYMPIRNTSTGYLRLIAPNTVFAEQDLRTFVGSRVLRCTVTYDSDMSSISTPYFPKFAEMAVLATKAYIYNNLSIELDEGQIRSGSLLGTFKERVESYADALELYNSKLDAWKSVRTLADTVSKRNMVKLAVGIGRFK